MSKFNAPKVVQFFAYIATGFIAVALLLSACFGSGNISRAFESIGQAIAYVVTLVVAGYFLRGKKHVAWLVCYVIFAVAIVVLYVVNLVL